MGNRAQRRGTCLLVLTQLEERPTQVNPSPAAVGHLVQRCMRRLSGGKLSDPWCGVHERTLPALCRTWLACVWLCRCSCRRSDASCERFRMRERGFRDRYTWLAIYSSLLLLCFQRSLRHLQTSERDLVDGADSGFTAVLSVQVYQGAGH